MSTEGGYVSAYLARLANGELPAPSRPAPAPAPPPPATPAPLPPAASTTSYRQGGAPTSAAAGSPAPVAPPAPPAASVAPAAAAPPPASAPPTPPPAPAPARPLSTNGDRATAPVRRARETTTSAPPEAAAAPAPPPRPLTPGPQARNRVAVERTLARAGFSEGFRGELTDTALAHTLALSPRIGMVPAVRAALAQRIPVGKPLPTAGCSIVVVGAGGSGKTTCCASLLGTYRAHSSLPARFATLVRAEVGTELELIMSPQMLEPQPADAPRVRRELRAASSDGVVVIDTPRLSPSEPGAIRELGRLLGELEPDRIVVALPVTLGAVAAEQLLASLDPIGPAALALTHADETDQLGVGVELACRFGLAPELMLEHAPAGGWRLQRLDPAELASRILR